MMIHSLQSLLPCMGVYRLARVSLTTPITGKALKRMSPLSDSFDTNYVQSMIEKETKNISLKAFLATEQRLPGIGNGVLQDILFNAGLHPKRKIQSLDAFDKETLVRLHHVNPTGHGGWWRARYGKRPVLATRAVIQRACPRTPSRNPAHVVVVPSRRKVIWAVPCIIAPVANRFDTYD